jgi:hypothetical protein
MMSFFIALAARKVGLGATIAAGDAVSNPFQKRRISPAGGHGIHA